MKFLAILVAIFMAVAYFDVCAATSEPVCMYTTKDGKNIFLHFFIGINKGQQYVDLASGGCTLAECQEDYTIRLSQC